jgi:hypothetical protein
MKALRMLISFLLPARNASMIAPFNSSPSPATAIMTDSWTTSGLRSRSTLS